MTDPTRRALLHATLALPLLRPWELFGSPATSPASGPVPNAATLADEVERAWERHDLHWWFPRCVDSAGGFFETFDDNGHGIPGTPRHCIFQSRMTWVAATICLRRPTHRMTFEPIVRHGLAFLMDRLSSPDGGVWWGVDVAGKPIENGERHLYNTSFAIYGASAAAEAVPDSPGLRLASRLFDWLEEHGRGEQAGYAEHYAADGHAILSADDPAAAPNGYGPLLPHYGDRSMNAQIHALEALTELAKVSEDPRVRERLAESFRLVGERLFGEPGFLHLWLNGADLAPLPDLTSYGHNVETAYLLVEAAERLGTGVEDAWQKAQALVQTALRVAWDTEFGALNDAGNTYEVRERRKDWWVQAESLNALLLLADHTGERRYAERFAEQWRFIRSHLLDEANGGWHWGVDEHGRVDEAHAKAGPWKAAYHTTRALLNVADRLRATPPTR